MAQRDQFPGALCGGNAGEKRRMQQLLADESNWPSLDPRQVIGQRAAAGPPLCSTGALQPRIGLLLFGLAGGNRLFEVLQPEIELVGIELLGTPAELHALKLTDVTSLSLKEGKGAEVLVFDLPGA